VKVLVQRVAWARVMVGEAVVGEIGAGLLLLVGVEVGDRREEVAAVAEKVAGLRIFADAAGKMNLDVRELGGSALVVSQFTLAGSLRRGRRPSFDGAAAPELARELVDELGRAIERAGVPVTTGRFAAHMRVESCNDGPVTFLLDVPPAAGTAPGGNANP
jgi:D-tyrosyl-tRNA(Tyr) deacylase